MGMSDIGVQIESVKPNGAYVLNERGIVQYVTSIDKTSNGVCMNSNYGLNSTHTLLLYYKITFLKNELMRSPQSRSS